MPRARRLNKRRKMITTLARRIAVLAIAAGLSALLAGCVSDAAAPALSDSSGTQLRYYGGPKYPMWQAQ
jgi:hypothetical protein